MQYNPLLGKSYGEIAGESRSQHKSQGFGASAQRGESYEYFSLTAGEPIKDNLFDGVDYYMATSKRQLINIEQQIDKIINDYQV